MQEDDDNEECQHVWRPYWIGNHISHWQCDKCDDYREEDY